MNSEIPAHDARLVPLDALKPYGRNPRRGDVAAIRESLRVNGQYRPVVVRRKTSEVLAGNHTLQAAREEGWAEVWATFIDCDAKTAKRIVLVDNRSNDLAGYDSGVLVDLLGELPSLEGTGYTPDALDELVRELLPAAERPSDDAPPVPKKPVTKHGDLWLLGEHRLLCGDSNAVTSIDQLLKGERPSVIFTDPPYGMDVDTRYDRMFSSDARHRVTGERFAPVIGDADSFDAASLVELFDDCAEQFWWGADYYRCTIPAGGSWVVWDKRDNDAGMNLDAVAGASFELCWSRQAHKREIARILWSGHHGMQGEDTQRRVHPTQKPVALAAWFFERWAAPSATVLDLYAGSGPTLLACEQTNRRCLAMEIDPGYCDVIVRRWEEYTGRQAERVTDGEAVEAHA